MNKFVKLISEKNVTEPWVGGGGEGGVGLVSTKSADFHQNESRWVRAQSAGLGSAHHVGSNKKRQLCVP